MRLIHTSDWHLGRSLLTLKRYEEFEAFLTWLKQTIIARQAEALIVAGDIFDTTAPANRAQEIYYNFLGSLVGTCCCNIVIVAGNHDSPSFLDAPKGVLKALNMHVVGTAATDPMDEIVVLRSSSGKAAAVVCAVPYLRDKDIRTVEAGETIEQKGEKLLQGIRDHYAHVCESALTMRQQIGDVPLIATGHLFTAGGKTIDEDGVKELYVGTLAHAAIDLFPPVIDYFALGHLHIPQIVSGLEHIRYSGSPLPMGFGEARQQKQVVLVDFDGRKPMIEEIVVPCFQPLMRISGDLDQIMTAIRDLVAQKSNAWVEVEYTGQDILPRLQEDIFDAVADSRLSVVRVKNQRLVNGIVAAASSNQTLEDLDELKVFNLCLEASKVSEEQRSEMLGAYKEILIAINEEDSNRE